MISPQRIQGIIDALRRGTVPQRGMDQFAVGLERLTPTLSLELDAVAAGGASIKCIRGDYGTGKTFLARWIQEHAKAKGFAVAEVQISETETPLHRLETVYRRSMERLSTEEVEMGAFRSIIDGWFFCLEEEAMSQGLCDGEDQGALIKATDALLEKRLTQVTRSNPAFAAALRGYRKAIASNDPTTAEALIAWLSGQPNVAASAKRVAGIKGEIDHFGALTCLQGLLLLLRDSGKPGLVLVLDEVETLQRVRGDVREKSLNAIRQLLDEVDGGRFPGLYLILTGTPSFFDGPLGVQRLAPLAQRLHVDFQTDSRFDNPRAVQVRLQAFDQVRLELVGKRVRDLYAEVATKPARIASLTDDAFLALMATRVTAGLAGKTGIAPRIFLKKLVADVLDRVDQFDDFDPRRDYQLTVGETELNDSERALVKGVDDIELENEPNVK